MWRTHITECKEPYKYYNSEFSNPNKKTKADLNYSLRPILCDLISFLEHPKKNEPTILTIFEH